MGLFWFSTAVRLRHHVGAVTITGAGSAPGLGVLNEKSREQEAVLSCI